MSAPTMIEDGDRMWTIEVDNWGKAVRWRPVTIVRACSLPVIEYSDGRRHQTFRSALYWQPNARTDLPVEAL